MIKDYKSRAIILSRINYGESDRILTLLTEDFGKVKVIAKGIRNQKSKLASCVELFSLSQIMFRPGRNEIGRLIGGELKVFFDQILLDIDRVQMGYRLLKVLDRGTEDKTDNEYFLIMLQTLTALNNLKLDLNLINGWFYGQMLVLAGYKPNLITTLSGDKLDEKKNYDFDFDNFTFYCSDKSNDYSVNDIKFLRLMFSVNNPTILGQVEGSSDLMVKLLPMIQTMFSHYIRV